MLPFTSTDSSNGKGTTKKPYLLYRQQGKQVQAVVCTYRALYFDVDILADNGLLAL